MQDYVQKVQDAYDQGAQSYAEFWQDAHEFIEPERSKFISILEPEAKIIDIGCGPGMDSENFYNLGFDIHGVDLSEEMVKIANSRVPQANFEVADMRNLSFDSDSTDAIWCSFSFLHISKEDASKVLENFYKFLKPGGILMLALHSPASSSHEDRDITGLKNQEGKQLAAPLQEWQEAEITDLIKAQGFNIEHSRSFTREGGWYPLLGIIAKK